jgi:small subunit ribosomal protein S27Ae
MQIFVANASGSVTSYEVDASADVEALKLMIENKEFIPSNLICLACGGAEVQGGSLAANGLEDQDTLALTLDVNGGMRAKWRKKRMRRLRKKRRKMRQRAR